MAQIIEGNLAKLGMKLPKVVAPVATYVPFKVVPGLSTRTVFVSGQIPKMDDFLYTGKVSAENLDHGRKAAEVCALNIMAQLKEACGGDLEKVKQIVRLEGFVNCGDDFTQQPQIINGASDLFLQVFGDKGVHSRFAVGTNSLPLGVSVEIAAIAEIEN